MSEILATVGSVNITEDDVNNFIRSLPSQQQSYATNPQFREQCLDQLIAAQCFALLGEEMELEQTEQFRTIMENARKDILSQLAVRSVLSGINVTDEEVRAFYDENPQHFDTGDKVSAKHILVEDEALCAELLGKILSGEVEFEAAAQEYSTCPSKSRGGDLGEFGRKQMVAEFEEAAFGAEVGAVVGPVKTQFGYHLIKVTGKKESSIVPFETVADQLKAQLHQQREQEAYNLAFAQLKAKYMK